MTDFLSINYTIAEILGYKMSLVELLGTVTGILAVILATQSNIWSWPVGIVNFVLAFILYYQVNLYSDMLNTKGVVAKSVLSFYEANATDNRDALVVHNNGETTVLPVLRQQAVKPDGNNLSLADFLLPEKENRTDYLGAFATSVAGAEEIAKEYAAQNDDYSALLIQSISDRIAEAAAEWLHLQVRCHFWGYAENEALSKEEILKEHYRGIRPAVGYPSLPDLSLIFDLNKLLNLSEIGISLTENGAMPITNTPLSSTLRLNTTSAATQSKKAVYK